MPHMISPIFVGVIVSLKHIRKKQEPYYDEKQEQLYQDDDPESFPHCHFAKTVVIKKPCLFQKSLFQFLCVLNIQNANI